MTAPTAAPVTTSRIACASLVLGILTYGGYILTFVVGLYQNIFPWFIVLPTVIIAVMSIICGHLAVHAIAHSGGMTKGKRLAIAGLVAAYIALALPVMFAIFAVLFAESVILRY